MCECVWVLGAGSNGDNKSAVRMQQPLLSPLPSSHGGTVPRVPVSVAGKGLALPFLGKMLVSGAVAPSSPAREVHLWLGRPIPGSSCHSSLFQLCSPFFSPGLYTFRPQPSNSVSGTGLSARAPTRDSLKQWHRADQIMEGGAALLSQRHFSIKD